jgi:hypothetical protein
MTDPALGAALIDGVTILSLPDFGLAAARQAMVPSFRQVHAAARYTA